MHQPSAGYLHGTTFPLNCFHVVCKLEMGTLVLLTAGPAVEQHQWEWLRIINLVFPGQHKWKQASKRECWGNISWRAMREQPGLVEGGCVPGKGGSPGYSQCCATRGCFSPASEKGSSCSEERLLFFANSSFEACTAHPIVPVWGLFWVPGWEVLVGEQGTAPLHKLPLVLFVPLTFLPALSLPASCSAFNRAHQKCLGKFSPNHGGGWDPLSSPKPSEV